MTFKPEQEPGPPESPNQPILYLFHLRIKPPLQLVHPDPFKLVHARLEPEEALIPHLLVYHDVLRPEDALLQSLYE